MLKKLYSKIVVRLSVWLVLAGLIIMIFMYYGVDRITSHPETKELILSTIPSLLAVGILYIVSYFVFWDIPKLKKIERYEELSNIVNDKILSTLQPQYVSLERKIKNIQNLVVSDELLIGRDLEREQSLLEFMHNSTDFLLVGHTLRSQCADIRNGLKNMIEWEPVLLRFAIVHPQLIDIQGLSKIYEMDQKTLMDDICSSLLVFAELLEISGHGRVEVKLLDTIPFLNTAVKYRTKKKFSVRCGIYLYNEDYTRRPYILLKEDHPMQAMFKEQAESLWKKNSHCQSAAELRSLWKTISSA